MKRSQRNLILAGIFVGIGFGIILITYLGGWILSPNPGDSVKTAPEVGFLAPDFQLESLSGEQIRLNDLHGRIVLINFWATWCGPCRIEMPSIENRFQTYRPDLVVLAVNFDEPREDVKDFVDRLGLNFEVLFDPGAKVQSLFRVRGYPTTFILDKNGVVKIQHIGVMTDSQLDGYLEKVGFVQ